jgi:hypothetical protein
MIILSNLSNIKKITCLSFKILSRNITLNSKMATINKRVAIVNAKLSSGQVSNYILSFHFHKLKTRTRCYKI